MLVVWLLPSGSSALGADAPAPRSSAEEGSYEPSRFQVWESLFVSATMLKPSYRRFVERMGLSGNERVLDFGSGSGAEAVHIAGRLSKGGHLICLDISRTWLETARKRLKDFSNVSFLLGDVRELNIPAESFDVVAIHLVLHDIPAADRPAVVKALARVMKKGARLHVREPLGDSHLGEGMTAAEVRSLLAGAGLRETSSRFEKFALWFWATYEGVYEKR
jgi:ubiquinone/menaquinone biosynthesis C-methylase UbiE